MAGDQAIATEELVEEATSAQTSPWSSLWQVPTVMLSIGLIVAGIVVAMQRAPENDFSAALDQVDQLLGVGELDVAHERLHDGIEPFLAEATELQRGRFHATVADWVAATQAAQGVHSPENLKRIGDQYTMAVAKGLTLSPARVETWAEAAILLGDFDTARKRLAQLEAMSLTASADPNTRQRRNRVLRQMVEENLRYEELAFAELMEILDSYRSDHMLSAEDDLWAIARQADLRLEQRLFQEAVDHLLIDSRRIETRNGADVRLQFGEIYKLLGRGYYHLGDFSEAVYVLDRSLELFDGPEPARGDALLLLALIDITRDEIEPALERFEFVLRDYSETTAYMPALLGRAEVLAVLGDHERAMQDYEQLRQAMAESGPRRDVTVDHVGQSLVDRHLSALASRDLQLALEYLELAEKFWSGLKVPEQILAYLAGTCRQIADNFVAEAQKPIDGIGPVPEVDPETRYRANGFYRRAGEYWHRHVLAIAGLSGQDEAWANSLYQAADAYDLGGDHDSAVKYFNELVDGRGIPEQMPSARFRLATAYGALGSMNDLELAAETWNELIANHPLSPEGERAYVPLARTYLALDRASDAEVVLKGVLDGNTPLMSESPEYQAALIELGTILHESGDYIRAIERLIEASGRYPDHERRVEVEFRLADSLRRRALQAYDRIEKNDTLSNAEQRKLEQVKLESFDSARERFATVIHRMRTLPSHHRDRLQEDMLRYSYLYEADCAFYLGESRSAIELYERVVRKYSDHHSSMNAMIQIVNCYSALGDDALARSAHNAAMIRLQQLPDTAFEAPDALMNRSAWQRWLTNSPLGSV